MMNETIAFCGRCRSGFGCIKTDDGLRCAACWMAAVREGELEEWKAEVNA